MYLSVAYKWTIRQSKRKQHHQQSGRNVLSNKRGRTSDQRSQGYLRSAIDTNFFTRIAICWRQRYTTLFVWKRQHKSRRSCVWTVNHKYFPMRENLILLGLRSTPKRNTKTFSKYLILTLFFIILDFMI